MPTLTGHRKIQAITAACYVYPANPAEVATVVQTASKYQCQFAIRGGGHSDIPGASNLENGLVLDLNSFKAVTLSPDKTFAVVGAGNSWGGRETTVGVAGLTLGGGVSFFSGQYGLASDNVLAYEVVLGNGTVATTSHENAPDLYHVLRGGGNNFAIETQFHLAAYTYDVLQGGVTTWSDSPATQKSLTTAFGHLAKTGDESPGVAMYLALVYASPIPEWRAGSYYTHSSPSIPTIPAYKPFFTTQLNSSRVSSTLRTGKQAQFASELGQGQPSGLREQFHTGMYIADGALLSEMFDILRDVAAKTRAKLQPMLTGDNPPEIFYPAVAFQPITRTILEAQQARGGNVLGLDPCGPPLMLMGMAWPWKMAENDHIFMGAMDELVKRTHAAAERRGLLTGFICMNYATPKQAVVQSYGIENVRQMKATRVKYDPEGVFQRLVPGGFKLG